MSDEIIGYEKGRCGVYITEELSLNYGRSAGSVVKFRSAEEAKAVRDALCERFGVPKDALGAARTEGVKEVVDTFNRYRPTSDELLSMDRKWLANRVTKMEDDLGALEQWLTDLTRVVQGVTPNRDGEFTV